MKNHPVADLFPMMSEEQIARLAADIKEHGQRDPILLDQKGAIIDGRNRFAACKLAKVKPKTEVFKGPEAAIIAVALSLNATRRHLTESQRALVAARLKPIYDEQAKKRMITGAKGVEDVPPPSKGTARDKAAAALSVSGRFVADAERVLLEGAEELVAAIDAGQAAVTDAVRAISFSKQEQRRAVQALLRGDAKTIKEALRKMRRAAQVRAIENAPPIEGSFDVVVVDPPWPYDKRAGDDTQRGQTPYPTMDLREIIQTPMPAKADAVLWLWVTNAHMRWAFMVLDAWSFHEKTILTWAKPRIGVGDWLRGQTEHCILAVRGRPVLREVGGLSTLLQAAAGEHSEKPDEFYALVEKLCPGAKAELFARKRRDGWATFGAELLETVTSDEAWPQDADAPADAAGVES